MKLDPVFDCNFYFLFPPKADDSRVELIDRKGFKAWIKRISKGFLKVLIILIFLQP